LTKSRAALLYREYWREVGDLTGQLRKYALPLQRPDIAAGKEATIGNSIALSWPEVRKGPARLNPGHPRRVRSVTSVEWMEHDINPGLLGTLAGVGLAFRPRSGTLCVRQGTLNVDQSVELSPSLLYGYVRFAGPLGRLVVSRSNLVVQREGIEQKAGELDQQVFLAHLIRGVHAAQHNQLLSLAGQSAAGE